MIKEYAIGAAYIYIKKAGPGYMNGKQDLL